MTDDQANEIAKAVLWLITVEHIRAPNVGRDDAYIALVEALKKGTP